MDDSLDVEITKRGYGLIPVGRRDRRRTPMMFGAKITPKDPALPECVLEIERLRPHRQLGNPPYVVAVLIRIQPGGPPLDSTNIRIPISHYLDEAISAASRESDSDDQKPPPAWGETRGRKITKEQLQRVADIYRRAVRDRKPPLRELERELQVAYSSSARLVGQARAAGLLGPPPRPGVAGELDES